MRLCIPCLFQKYSTIYILVYSMTAQISTLLVLSLTEELEVFVAATDGLPMPDVAPDVGSRTAATNLLGAGAQFPALQPPAQSVAAQRASSQVRLCQVADRPGLLAILDQMGNVVQFVQTQNPQLSALPPTAAIATPAALWTGAGASAAPTHTQLLEALPAAAEQQLNPYSVVVTTAQSIQNTLQQQQEFSTLTTLGPISSADYGINPQLTQISPQTGASGDSILCDQTSNLLYVQVPVYA